MIDDQFISSDEIEKFLKDLRSGRRRKDPSERGVLTGVQGVTGVTRKGTRYSR
jgi:hypothetical protein